MIVPTPNTHFPDPLDESLTWCGGAGHRTIWVDAVGCADCLLLEGFRWPNDPERKAKDDATADELRRKWRERHATATPMATAADNDCDGLIAATDPYQGDDCAPADTDCDTDGDGYADLEHHLKGRSP